MKLFEITGNAGNDDHINVVHFLKPVDAYTKIWFMLKYRSLIHWKNDFAMASLIVEEFNKKNKVKLNEWQWKIVLTAV